MAARDKKTTTPVPDWQDELERRSYYIWEREGRPDGRELEHWLRAQRELEAEIATREEEPKTRRVRRPATNRKRSPG